MGLRFALQLRCAISVRYLLPARMTTVYLGKYPSALLWNIYPKRTCEPGVRFCRSAVSSIGVFTGFSSSGPARAVSCSCPLVCARAFGGFKKDMANATTRPSLKPHLNRSVNSFVCILVFPIAYVFDLQQVSDDMTVTAIFA